MNEYLSLLIRDTKEKVVDAYNRSGLHIDILAYISDEVNRAIHEQAEEQYRRDGAAYLKQQEQERKDGNKEVYNVNPDTDA